MDKKELETVVQTLQDGKTFEQVVREMSATEIIMAMVNGLKKPCVKINMSYYGRAFNDICYGCAATVTICNISGVTFTPENIESVFSRAKAVNTTGDFLDNFEYAINQLRLGYIGLYNESARHLGIAEIEMFPECYPLPALRNDNYKNEIKAYRLLAKKQPPRKESGNAETKQD